MRGRCGSAATASTSARIEQNLLVVTAGADHIAPRPGTLPLLDRGRQRRRHAPRPPRRPHRPHGRLEGAQRDLARHRRVARGALGPLDEERGDPWRAPTAQEARLQRRRAQARRPRGDRHRRHARASARRSAAASRRRAPPSRPATAATASAPSASRPTSPATAPTSRSTRATSGRRRTAGAPCTRSSTTTAASTSSSTTPASRPTRRVLKMTDEDWYKVLARQPLGRVLHVAGGTRAHGRARHGADREHLLDRRPDGQHRPGELRRVEVGPLRSHHDAGPRGRHALKQRGQARGRRRRPHGEHRGAGLHRDRHARERAREGPGRHPRASARSRASARPEEIARVVHFLAADASAYITGQVWAVNGGHDM